MIPLTHCPHCQSLLVKKTIPEHLNPTKYENCSKRCVVDYFQYYNKSYEETELEYVSLYTPDHKFSMYYYTKHHMYPANLVHVYSQAEIKKHGRAMPLITLKDFQIDFNNLEDLQDKLSLYATFV
jgi:hypothetical protein